MYGEPHHDTRIQKLEEYASSYFNLPDDQKKGQKKGQKFLYDPSGEEKAKIGHSPGPPGDHENEDITSGDKCSEIFSLSLNMEAAR